MVNAPLRTKLMRRSIGLEGETDLSAALTAQPKV